MKLNKYNINLFIIGIIIITLILWNRIFRVRIPKYIPDILSEIQVIILIFLILISLGIVIYYVKEVLNIKSNKKSLFYKGLIKISSNKFISNINDKYKKYIIYILPEKQKDKLTSFIRSSASDLVVYIKRRIVYFGFILTPKILVCFIFLIDIFHFHQLNYFYKSLILLTIPLITKIYLFIISDASIAHIDYYNKHLNWEKSDKGTLIATLKEQPTFENALDISKVKLIRIYYEWEIWSEIDSYTFHLKEFENKYKPYEFLIMYSCYFIGWSYYLFSSLYIIFTVKYIDPYIFNIFSLIIGFLLIIFSNVIIVVTHQSYIEDNEQQKDESKTL